MGVIRVSGLAAIELADGVRERLAHILQPVVDAAERDVAFGIVRCTANDRALGIHKLEHELTRSKFTALKRLLGGDLHGTARAVLIAIAHLGGGAGLDGTLGSRRGLHGPTIGLNLIDLVRALGRNALDNDRLAALHAHGAALRNLARGHRGARGIEPLPCVLAGIGFAVLIRNVELERELRLSGYVGSIGDSLGDLQVSVRTVGVDDAARSLVRRCYIAGIVDVLAHLVVDLFAALVAVQVVERPVPTAGRGIAGHRLEPVLLAIFIQRELDFLGTLALGVFHIVPHLGARDGRLLGSMGVGYGHGCFTVHNLRGDRGRMTGGHRVLHHGIVDALTLGIRARHLAERGLPLIFLRKHRALARGNAVGIQVDRHRFGTNTISVVVVCPGLLDLDLERNEANLHVAVPDELVLLANGVLRRDCSRHGSIVVRVRTTRKASLGRASGKLGVEPGLIDARGRLHAHIAHERLALTEHEVRTVLRLARVDGDCRYRGEVGRSRRGPNRLVGQVAVGAIAFGGHRKVLDR